MSSKKEKKAGHKKSKKEDNKVESQIVDQLEPSCNEETSSGVTINDTKSTKSRGKRGVVTMAKVVARKAVGKKLKVWYNQNGIPKGKTRSKLQSYIGMLARSRVPINIRSWHVVDKDLKAKLWADVQDTFTMKPESRKFVLTSAGTKWKGFKTLLTRKHVLPYLGNKKLLRKPPKKYSFVGLEPWKHFVKERSTEEWMELHRLQSERVKQRKYHHKLSRKGYVGLYEELSESLPEGEEIDRATMWKKAHEPKVGKTNKEFEEVAKNIDELLKKKEKGQLEISGSSDVLTQALGTREHSGRVRGVGGSITATRYFDLPKEQKIRITKAELLARDKQRAKELTSTIKRLEEQQAKSDAAFQNKIAELVALVKGKGIDFETNLISPLSDKGSSHMPKRGPDVVVCPDDVVKSPTDCFQIDPPTSVLGPECELAFENIENIVAYGTVIEADGLNEMIHGIPLPVGSVRVSVVGEIKPESSIPFPVEGELETVREAVGSHVAWPNELVIRKASFQKKKRKIDCNKSLFGKASISKMVPKRCLGFYKYAKTTMLERRLTIRSDLDDDVFGHERELCVIQENVVNLLEFDMIGEGVITT